MVLYAVLQEFSSTLLCLQHHFGTTFTIFTKFKYELDFNNFAITLQPSRNKEVCPFPILIEKYRVLQLLWCEKSQSSWRSFHVFPYQNLICYFSIWWKEQHQQLITYYKLIKLFLVDFFLEILEKIATFDVALFPILLLEYVTFIKKIVY